MKKIFSTILLLLLIVSASGYAENDIATLDIDKLDGGSTLTIPAGGHLTLPQTNEPLTPTLSFGDGDSGFIEKVDDTIQISIAGAAAWEITSSYLVANSGCAGLRMATPSSTLASVVPNLVGDLDTGVGTAGLDMLSLIAGGVEGHRITEAAGLIDHVLTGIVKTPTTQTLTDAAGVGAIDIVSAITHIISTGTDALSLANGAEGQHKYIIMKTDGGTATLTPTSPGNFTTIVFDDVGDSAQLLFTNGKWYWMGGTATY